MTKPQATATEIAILRGEVIHLAAETAHHRERLERARKLNDLGHRGVSDRTRATLQQIADRATLKLIAARLKLARATDSLCAKPLYALWKDLPPELTQNGSSPPVPMTPSEPHQVSEPSTPANPCKELITALDNLIEYMWDHENIDTQMVQGATFTELAGEHILSALAIVEFYARPTSHCNPQRLFAQRLADEVARLRDDDYDQLHASVADLQPRNRLALTAKPPANNEWQPIETYITAPLIRLGLTQPVKVAGIGWQGAARFHHSSQAWYASGGGLGPEARLHPTHWRPIQEGEPRDTLPTTLSS